jgi:hypothetical protein
VTLAGHGRRSVGLPDEVTSAAASDHPEIAGRLGL